jgi:hypothetical protein
MTRLLLLLILAGCSEPKQHRTHLFRDENVNCYQEGKHVTCRPHPIRLTDCWLKFNEATKGVAKLLTDSATVEFTGFECAIPNGQAAVLDPGELPPPVESTMYSYSTFASEDLWILQGNGR